MPELPDPVVKVEVTKKGLEFTRLVDYEIDSDYFGSTDGFKITLYDDDQDKIAGLELQTVEISVDGAPQLPGRIDVSDIGETSAITYMGRDYIADMVECQVDPGLVIKEGASLFDALVLAAGPVNIDTVLDDGELALRDVRSGKKIGAKPLPAFKTAKSKDLKPQENDGIYQFCNRMVARFGATIQPSTNRNELLVTAPNYGQDPSFSIRVLKDRNLSNAYNCKAHRDYSKMPTYGLFQGRGSTPGKVQSPLSTEYNIAVAASVLNEAYFRETGDELIRHAGNGRRKPAPNVIFPSSLYRLLYLRDTTARDQAQLDAALRRAVADRTKETLVYTCTVKGHRDPVTGVIYSTDLLCNVDDEIRRVHEVMWVAARKFKYTEGSGAETDLTLMRKGVIQL